MSRGNSIKMECVVVFDVIDCGQRIMNIARKKKKCGRLRNVCSETVIEVGPKSDDGLT